MISAVLLMQSGDPSNGYCRQKAVRPRFSMRDTMELSLPASKTRTQKKIRKSEWLNYEH